MNRQEQAVRDAAARQQRWEDALDDCVRKARTMLPGCGARIMAAYDLVRNGHVTIMDAHTAEVIDPKAPGGTYRVNGACACPDFSRAPHGQCKHRLARGLYVRTSEALQAEQGVLSVETRTDTMQTPNTSAQVALEAFETARGYTYAETTIQQEYRITDLLTSLMHYAAEQDLYFDVCLRKAQGYYHEAAC